MPQKRGQQHVRLDRVIEGGIDIARIYDLLDTWKNKKAALDKRAASADDAKNRLAEERMRQLQAYAAKSLTTLKSEGYPVPLAGIGPAKLKQ